VVLHWRGMRARIRRSILPSALPAHHLVSFRISAPRSRTATAYQRAPRDTRRRRDGCQRARRSAAPRRAHGIPGLPQRSMACGPVPRHRAHHGVQRSHAPATPAPMGFSVGHPSITAAPSARACVTRWAACTSSRTTMSSPTRTMRRSGDPEYQPGPYDRRHVRRPDRDADDFQVISFAAGASNTMDAAIAMSSTSLLDNSVPATKAMACRTPRFTETPTATGCSMIPMRCWASTCRSTAHHAPHARADHRCQCDRHRLLRVSGIQLHQVGPLRGSADHRAEHVQRPAATPGHSS